MSGYQFSSAIYKNQRDRRLHNNNNYNNNNNNNPNSNHNENQNSHYNNSNHSNNYASNGTISGQTASKSHGHNNASGTSLEISVSRTQTYSGHSSKKTRSRKRASFVSKTFKMGDKHQNLSYPSRYILFIFMFCIATICILTFLHFCILHPAGDESSNILTSLMNNWYNQSGQYIILEIRR